MSQSRGPLQGLTASLAGLALALLPAIVSAQPAAASLSASYALLRDPDADRSYTAGGGLGASARLVGWLGVAVEVAASAAGEDFSSTGGGTYDFRYESIHAGPRLTPSSGSARPYVELLAGVTRWRIRERRLNPGGWESASDFSLQPGVGIDLFFSPRLALRVGGEARLMFKHDSRFDRDYRSTLYVAHAGISLHFGGP
jgi:hypothetical protein